MPPCLLADPGPHTPMTDGQAATEAFSRQWTSALPALSAYVHSLIPNWEQAEDVLQDAAVVALRRYGDFDPSGVFRAWVFGIVRTLALESRRKVAVARLRFDDDVVELLAVTAERNVDHLADTRKALHACLTGVEGRARDALHLRYVEGSDYDGIAAHLRMSAVAARKLVSRLHARLRTCIEERLAMELG